MKNVCSRVPGFKFAIVQMGTKKRSDFPEMKSYRFLVSRKTRQKHRTLMHPKSFRKNY